MPKAYSINPDRREPWNTMPSLPLAPELYKSVEVLEALVEAKSELGKLQGRSIAIPNQAMLINSISLQEAKASNEVENIFTTDNELYKAFSQNDLESITGAAKEVLHYREAIWKGREHLQAEGKFDRSYFEQMYREVTGNRDGFRAPHAQIVIKRGGTGPNDGEVVFTPPRGQGLIEQLLDNTIEFLNRKDDSIDPLLKMAIAHFQYEAIHPFRDGNGRTGRLLNIHFLNYSGLLDYPILFLSKYIIENKEEYHARLEGVWKRGSWQPWILYMLKAVETTSRITFQKITDILHAKDVMLNIVQSQSDIRRPESLIDQLFLQPYARVAHFTDRGIYAENTARNYLNQLTELQLLQKLTISGHHYYMNTELYHILSR